MLGKQKRLELKHIVLEGLKFYDLSVRKVRFYAEEDHFLYLVYTVDTKYMLKLCNKAKDPSKDETLLFSWLQYLNQDSKGFVNQPLKNAQSQPFTNITSEDSGDFSMVIYPWIPGSMLKTKLSIKSARKWGRLLAEIHKRSECFFIPIDSVYKSWNQIYYWEPKVLFKEAFRSHFPKDRKATFQAMEKRVREGLNELHKSPFQPILIHGDLHPSNVKVHQGQLFALDFDDFMLGFPVQDIAVALLYIRHLDNYPDLKKEFKTGYEEVKSWPEQYPHQIELFFMARLLWMTNACLASGSLDDIEDRLSRYEEEFKIFLRL